MNEIDITLEELLSEIQQLSFGQQNGFTTKEMGKHFNRDVRWCRKILGSLIEAGRAECIGTKRIIRIDGNGMSVPVYRFVK